MAATDCVNCGVCCTGQNLLPYTGNMLAPRDLPPALKKELLAVAGGPLFGNDDWPCLWLDRAKGRCKHYEHRPNICREFKANSDDCLRIRAQFGLTSD